MRTVLRPAFGGVALLVLGVLAGSVATCAAPAAPAGEGAVLTEEQKIDKLIAVIAGMKDASFVRKGQEYDAGSAAKFLREKWDWIKGDDLKTAKDFVKVATGGNAGTGTPYFIKFADGKLVGAGEFLGGELAKMEENKSLNH